MRAGLRQRQSFYARLLRLRWVNPSGWQRAMFIEGALALGVVLALADVASAWTIVVLPLVVALIVKAHDVLAGFLARTADAKARRESPRA